MSVDGESSEFSQVDFPDQPAPKDDCWLVTPLKVGEFLPFLFLSSAYVSWAFRLSLLVFEGARELRILSILSRVGESRPRWIFLAKRQLHIITWREERIKRVNCSRVRCYRVIRLFGYRGHDIMENNNALSGCTFVKRYSERESGLRAAYLLAGKWHKSSFPWYAVLSCAGRRSGNHLARLGRYEKRNATECSVRWDASRCPLKNVRFT